MTVRELSEISNLSPAARELVRDDSTPAAYLASLEQQKLYQDAIRFQAHKMSIEAGIKWAAGCAREMQPADRKEKKDEALEASERWIEAPGDAARRQAKEAADGETASGSTKLLAMGVFMSGGSITPPGSPEVNPPPYSGQKLIAGSILVSVVGDQPDKSAERYQRALAMGKTLDQPGKQ